MYIENDVKQPTGFQMRIIVILCIGVLFLAGGIAFASNRYITVWQCKRCGMVIQHAHSYSPSPVGCRNYQSHQWKNISTKLMR